MVHKHDNTRGKTRADVYSDFLSRKNYIAGSAHNLYNVYSDDKHKIIAPPQASSNDWNDERIRATLWPERRQEIFESIAELVIFALFGAMIVLALFT